MLLQGKRVVVMGLLGTNGFAWAIGQRAAAEGAEVIYTVQTERFRDTLLRRSFRQANLSVDDHRILPCDVTKDEEIATVFSEIEGDIHGLVHAIAYANPKTCMGGTMFEASREDVVSGFMVSAASLVFVANAARDKMPEGSSIVAMTFDTKHIYPSYNWMGVYKTALEGCAGYLARDLGPTGIRVNCISAGPQQTTAASHIPGFEKIGDEWPQRAPLGWSITADREVVANSTLYFLSDLSRGVTGEVHNVDGGFNKIAMVDSRSIG